MIKDKLLDLSCILGMIFVINLYLQLKNFTQHENKTATTNSTHSLDLLYLVAKLLEIKKKPQQNKPLNSNCIISFFIIILFCIL